MIPTLNSFTFSREAVVPGTDKIRLDFYEMAAARMTVAGVPSVFKYRVDETSYVARFCPSPPVEVIVKNVSAGSTLRKYPGLFAAGHQFTRPVVKFDYRTDPEDQAIADDYVRELGLDVQRVKDIALQTNNILRDWLAPRSLWDFCIIVGLDDTGKYWVNSEISPDSMRLKDADGSSLDKDLFRRGASEDAILTAWSGLVAELG
jgi:phosphoribosylaminoimidazole-succinocarboxamide synthase